MTWTVVDAEDVGERADVVLGRRLSSVTRRGAKSMALDGSLWIDGERAAPSARVAMGSQLELRWRAPDPTTPGDPPIVAVTDDFVYANKPSGVFTHRLRPDDDGSLADLVAVAHPECASASKDPREGGVVHRLDRETTGVVAFARNPQAWTAARAALAGGRCDKIYSAIGAAPPTWPPNPGDPSMRDDVREAPADATAGSGLPLAAGRVPVVISAPLGHGRGRASVSVRADGATARTVVWPSVVGIDHALFGLRLHTGRRHQARVHLAWVGAPIVGDAHYGVGEPPLMLHSLALDLSAAVPAEVQVFATPPAPMVAFLSRHAIAWPGP